MDCLSTVAGERAVDRALSDGSGVVTRTESQPVCAQNAIELTRRKLAAYGGLALPLCLAEIPIVLYLPAFYAQELRLSTGFVGVVFLLARCWDGMSDVIVGWLSDKSTSSLGRRKPWVIAGAPFLMASTWYLCNPPASAGLLYLSFWAALFYTAFTAVKIPHLSWGTELATGYVERSRVTSFREAFTMLGNLFFVSGPLIFLSSDAPLRDVLFLISVTTLVAVPLTTVPLSIFVPDPRPRHRTESHLFREIGALAKDRILGRFLIARLIFATEEGIANSLLVFSFAVGLQLPHKLFWTIFVLYIATLCALPVALALGRRVEKHRLLAAGMGIQALVYGLVLLMPPASFVPVLLLWTLLGFANTAMLSMPTSILADIIDNGEMNSGERRAGAYVAIDNLVYKLGLAFGVGVSFGLLALVHYDPGAMHHSSLDMVKIRVLGFGLPSVLSMMSGLIYLRHPITRKRQQRIRERIEARQLAERAGLRADGMTIPFAIDGGDL